MTQARRATGKAKSPGGWDPSRMKRQTVKLATGGNAKCDRDWIAEMGDDLVKFDQPPKDCFWDVEWQFQGYADEVNPEFYEAYRRGDRPCVGLAYIRDERGGYILDLNGDRLQRPCLRPAILGGTVCNRHGGQLEQTREAAQRFLVDASEKAITTLIVLTGAKDENNEPVEQRVRVQAANSVLDRAGIKGGSTVEIQLPGYKQVIDRMFSDAD